MIDIDQRSLELLGPFNQWPRLYLAQTLGILAQQARAVGVDLLILDPDGWSQRLQTQMEALGLGTLPPAMYQGFDPLLAALPGNVVWASHLDLSGENPTLLIPRPTVLNPSAPHGFANLFPDADGVVRSAIEGVALPDGGVEPSLVWRLAQVAGGTTLPPPSPPWRCT